MKILLFGQHGQVGWELQRSLAPLGALTSLSTNSTHLCGDFMQLDGLTQTIATIAPDVIVNAAAYTAVDKAETDVEKAYTLNALAPEVLARAARQSGALLIHYSTDYVFDGSGEQPWLETDTPHPLSVYGRTKHQGEQMIQHTGCRHLIFRTSWVYSARGGNFAKTMLRLAQERDQLSVINDQFGAPTGADLLADVTAHCLRQTMTQPELGGLYHLVAGGVTTWYDYARFVVESARAQGAAINLLPEALSPIPTSSYPTPARRPTNSRLNTQKLQKNFQLQLPQWQAGVTRMLSEISEKTK